MNYFVYILFFFAISNTAYSQDTLWFDAEWNPTTRNSAEYFRPEPQLVDGKYKFMDYYMSTRTLQGIGYSLKKDEEIFDGTVKYYSKEGNLKGESDFKNGKADGKATDYFSNGKPRALIFFKDGKPEGLATEYYDNGDVQTTWVYKNGNKEGKQTGFYKGGKVMYEGDIEDNRKEGKYTAYYENGKVHKEGNYKNNEPDGEWKYYNEEGELLVPGISTVAEEQLSRFEYLKRDYVYILDISEEKAKEGEFTELYPDNTIALKGYYRSGKREGEWKYYSVNGNVRVKENYAGGKLQNKQTFYFRDGSIFMEIPFRNNLLHGMVVMFNDKGEAVKNLFFIDGNEVENRSEFHQKFYKSGVTTSGNVQVINLDKTNDPYEIDDTSVDVAKAEMGKVKLDTIVNELGMTQASGIFKKEVFESETKDLDEILLNIYTNESGLKVIYTAEDYSPKENEVAFFLEYPDKSTFSGQQMFFRLGRKVMAALQNNSLDKYEIIELIESRVFDVQTFSGMAAGIALMNAMK